jgi:predicted TIM-barrel fold metal-dependent hydrolase
VECEIAAQLRFDLHTYLRRNFIVDTVQKTPGAAGLAADTYGLERIVYGTDYPWIDRRGSWDASRNAFGQADFESILANEVPGLRVPSQTR